MIKAAVLGSPISHSLSPLLHERAYQILGVEASYQAVEVRPENAKEFFKAAIEENWTGFSLTMPLKESVIDVGVELGFWIDPVAQKMKSGNTMHRQGQTFQVTSTDRTGFMRLFEGVECAKTLIIGGGGTARAALSALDGQAEEIDFLLRSPSRQDALLEIAQDSSLSFYPMDHALDSYDLVISTVPAGVTDAMSEALTSAIPTFCEVLYNPFPTKLLERARSLGASTIDGIDLLVEQALDQIALFSGVEFEYTMMRDELQRVARTHLNS